jgi:hypothetical protein
MSLTVLQVKNAQISQNYENGKPYVGSPGILQFVAILGFLVLIV